MAEEVCEVVVIDDNDDAVAASTPPKRRPGRPSKSDSLRPKQKTVSLWSKLTPNQKAAMEAKLAKCLASTPESGPFGCKLGAKVGNKVKGNGYVWLQAAGACVLVHCASYFVANKAAKELPAHNVSHLCNNTKCFRPDHLVYEDRVTNNRRKGCAGVVTATLDDGSTLRVIVCKHEPKCLAETTVAAHDVTVIAAA